ncbi:MAG TPA: hypothetical protein VGQ76_26920 [Thermoanaerobaculia bacterium]|nr:hypothetical protein [Thermoanaerobaculia bacterium]
MLIAPKNAANTRFNIGIRTLQATSMTIHVHDTNGDELHTVTRSLPANYFQQFAVADLAGVAPGSNQLIVIEIESGSAIVYGASIENESGNGTLQIARRTTE